MSVTQRRHSQRLASTLDALSADLDFQATDIETEMDENVCAGEKSTEQYWEGKAKGDEAIQLLSQDEEELDEALDELEEASDNEEDFDEAFEAAMAEDQEENAESSLMQGDPGVDDVGSQATKDTSNVRDLGDDYGINFDGDQDLQDSIRDVPGRTAREAKIKKLIARIENVANVFEKRGKKALAYRLDIVCNNLQANYLNK